MAAVVQATAPEQGARLLFFSGGSALNGLSRQLTAYTHNSVHLITPFDSGGSSAALRTVFDMPGIGDVRSRLMALSDAHVQGNYEVRQLFNYRLPHSDSCNSNRKTMEEIAGGRHHLITAIPIPIAGVIREQLQKLLLVLPDEFDFRGAAIGNLILTSHYLHNDRNLDATLERFSELLAVRGTIRTTVDSHLHLAATLRDQTVVLGQHRMTGKELTPLESPIESIFLSEDLNHAKPAKVALPSDRRALIEQAELICYAPGSFYSSLLANFLPEGVGHAIASNRCPKVYVPNLGVDPEQLGMAFHDLLSQLLAYLTKHDPNAEVSSVLSHVLIDSRSGAYTYPLRTELMQKLGIELLDLPLITEESAPYYDNRRLLDALMSLRDSN